MLNSRPNREDILRRCVARPNSDAFFLLILGSYALRTSCCLGSHRLLELAATGSGSQIYRAMTLLLYGSYKDVDMLRNTKLLDSLLATPESWLAAA